MSENTIREARKIIEDLLETGFNVADTPSRRRARQFLAALTSLDTRGEGERHFPEGPIRRRRAPLTP